MTGDSTSIRRLGSLLESGCMVMGQVVILKQSWTLHHREDDPVKVERSFTAPEAAREIAKYDENGNYRPLKTAPNLIRGWVLKLSSLDEVKLALDFLYPAMWGTWMNRDSITPINLRETLGRQTGMYRVTQKITDADANTVIGETCNSQTGCLRKILWRISDEVVVEGMPKEKFTLSGENNEVPLLCAEACNLLVAAMRQKLKGPAA